MVCTQGGQRAKAHITAKASQMQIERFIPIRRFSHLRPFLGLMLFSK
jgi:hypothetical protein